MFKNLFASPATPSCRLPTLIIIDISNIILSWWAIVVLLVIIGGRIVAFKQWIETENGRAKWDRFKLRPPIFGQLMHKVAHGPVLRHPRLARSSPACRSSSPSTSSRRPPETWSSAMRCSGGQGRACAKAAPSPTRSESTRTSSPSLVVQMVEVGEQTGALDNMLRKVAEFYDGEVESTVNNLTSLLEPMLTVVMGAGVGVMVIAMYLPMFTYIKHIPQS